MRSLTRTLTLAITAATAVAAGSLIGATTAVAVEQPGAITRVDMPSDTVDAYALTTVDIDWAFPAGAAPGDHATVVFPDEIDVAVPSFPVTADDGDVIAHADVTTKSVTLTLTDQAAGRQNLGGTVNVGARWALRNIPASGTKTFDFRSGETVFTDTVVLPPRTPRDRYLPLYWVRWVDPSDQGTRNPVGAAQWAFEAPAARKAAPVSWEITFPTSGDRIDCASVALQIGTVINEWSVLADAAPRPDLLASSTCEQAQEAGSPTFTVKTAALEIGQIAQVRYLSDVQPDHGDALVHSASTHLDLGTVAFSRTATARFTVGVGDATGDGIAVSTFVRDLGPEDGAAPAQPGIIVDPALETVTRTIVTNAGTHALTSLRVYSTTKNGPTLSNLSCDFSAHGGPSTGAQWDGPLAPGASIECEASVPALGAAAAHDHVVYASGVGAVSNKDVLASASLFLATEDAAVVDPGETDPEVTEPEVIDPGVIDPGVVAPEVIEPGVTAPGGATDADGSGTTTADSGAAVLGTALASTGAPTWAGGAALAALVLLAAGALVTVRTARRARSTK